MNVRRIGLAALALASSVSFTQLPAAAASGSVFGNLAYRSIGPAISGGRATAVAGSDSDPLVYYAGGAGGGVFKSTDGGASWHPVFDRESVAPIGAIALDRRNPENVWVGTGESNPRNTAESGLGVWHSTNGGKTWKHEGLSDTGNISTISIDPRDAQRVVVGVLGTPYADSTARGVFVTNDGGAHWSRTVFVGPGSGVSEVARVPDRPWTLFAGVWQFRRQPWSLTSGGPSGGLYRSDDGGLTWRKLSGHGLPTGVTGKVGVSAGTGGRVYARIQSREGELWRSDDYGATWRKMPHSPLVGARPFYFTHVFVDPANPNRLINVELILSMSTDGGKTFHAIAKNGGWDYHYTWWSSDGRRLINANDEGVILSADGGNHWWQPYALPFSQPYHVGFDNVLPHYHVCIGLQDDSSWCAPSSSDNGVGVLNRDWRNIAPGDGMWSIFDPSDPNIVWSTETGNNPGQVFITDLRTNEVSEVSPESHFTGGQPASTYGHRFNWDMPIAFTSGEHPELLAGGNVVFATDDRGQHWRVISPDLTRNDKSHQRISGGPVSFDMSGAENADTIMDIAPSMRTSGVIWVSTDDGLVQLTRDAGTGWNNVTPSALPKWARVPTVEPGHYSDGTAYIAADNHMLGDNRPYLFETDDYGRSWRSIKGDLPSDLFVRVVREDPVNRNLLYAGTQRGVWVSFDRGAHWLSLRLNMPATAIYDLQIQPQMNDLIVAAHGRGVWILDDLRPLQEWNGARASSAVLFTPRDAYKMNHYSPLQTFSGQPDNQFVGQNAPAGTAITYYLARPQHGVAIDILDAGGRVVKHIRGKSAPGKAGLNRISWDMTEDGPQKWKATFKQNQGPDEGADVAPGSYTVRLRAGGVTQAAQFAVKSDPRVKPDPQAESARYVFLYELYAEVNGVDTMLNRLDVRLHSADGPHKTALLALRSRVTQDPDNDEDLGLAPKLRERLLDLISRVGNSYQAPTPSMQAVANELRSTYEAVSASYHRI